MGCTQAIAQSSAPLLKENTSPLVTGPETSKVSPLPVVQDPSRSPEELYQSPIQRNSIFGRTQKVIISHKTRAALNTYKSKVLSRQDLDHDDQIYLYHSEKKIDTEKFNKNKPLPHQGAKTYNPYMRTSKYYTRKSAFSYSNATSDSEENPQNEDKLSPYNEKEYNSTPNSCRLRSNSQCSSQIKSKKFNRPNRKSSFALVNYERQNGDEPARLDDLPKKIYNYARSDDESTSPKIKHTTFFTTDTSGSKNCNDDLRNIADPSIVNRSSQNVQLCQYQVDQFNRETQSLHYFTAKRPKKVEIPKKLQKKLLAYNTFMTIQPPNDKFASTDTHEKDENAQNNFEDLVKEAPTKPEDTTKLTLRRNLTVEERFLGSNEPDCELNHKPVIFF